jgi:hypothetical protein
VACEAARRFVHPLQLPAELAVPLALGTPRQLEATKQDPLPCSGLLGPPKSLLDPLALLALALGLLGSIRCQHLKLALGRPDRVLAFAHLASRFNLCPAQGSTELTCAYVGTTPGIEPEHGPERQRDHSDDLGAVERCGSRADDKQQHHRGRDENDRGNRLQSLRRVEIHGTPAERCPGHTHVPWFTAGHLSLAARRSVNAYAKPFAANVARIAGGPAEEFDSIPPLPACSPGPPPSSVVPHNAPAALCGQE